jgi:hypothetical protein
MMLAVAAPGSRAHSLSIRGASKDMESLRDQSCVGLAGLPAPYQLYASRWCVGSRPPGENGVRLGRAGESRRNDSAAGSGGARVFLPALARMQRGAWRR